MLEQKVTDRLGRFAAAGLAGAAVGAAALSRARVRRLTLALAVEQQRLRWVLQAIEELDAAVGIFIDGQDGIRNLRAVELGTLAGVDRDPDAPSTGISVYGPDGSPVAPEDQVAQRARNGEDFSRVVQWFGEPGEQVAVSATGRQIRDDHGNRIGTMVVGWDVTDLHESIRVRDEFIATVSHELRTPLTSILGYLEILAEDPDDPDTRDHLVQVVTRNARTLKSRIDLLLTSRHVDGEDARLARVATDVSALTRTVVEDHRLELERAGISVTVAIIDGVVAEVDPRALRQVCDNLVSNAVKYAAGTTLHVRLQSRAAPEELVLVVADAGPGMTSHDARHAFERFYRSESATRGAVPGMGVGLAITQRLVELHGGTIEIDSAVGRGTTVRVVLPLHA